MASVYTVIMAGGSGTRFWPLSRKARPKQFLPLAGDGTTALLTATARRVESLSPLSHTLVVTREDLADATREALPGLPEENLLLEPVGRNTAPCVAWATHTVLRRDPEAVLVVLAADAFIEDEGAFVGALQTAARAASRGSVVTLGIQPTRPETGYGYLHAGEVVLPGDPSVRRVRAFVEKPDGPRAEAFFRGGEHLWNAGIFVYRADVMRAAVGRYLPDLAQAMTEIDSAAREGPAEGARAVGRLYGGLPNVSIDVGVMERLEDVLVVPVSCGWSDVGSWQAAWELAPRDPEGNAVKPSGAPAVLVEARGNMVVAPEGKVVALLGVDDLVVVDTPDALLVMPRARAQELKKIIDALNTRKDRAL
ncbi:MAG: mannose-1-phosphate guanylyltransferase [Deltaproteobacteria bacterium]|nr:mannose-1-phosphate guanylyltransferase [Deltaproteobacteria bacterium]